MTDFFRRRCSNDILLEHTETLDIDNGILGLFFISPMIAFLLMKLSTCALTVYTLFFAFAILLTILLFLYKMKNVDSYFKNNFWLIAGMSLFFWFLLLAFNSNSPIYELIMNEYPEWNDIIVIAFTAFALLVALGIGWATVYILFFLSDKFVGNRQRSFFGACNLGLLILLFILFSLVAPKILLHVFSIDQSVFIAIQMAVIYSFGLIIAYLYYIPHKLDA